MAHNVKIKYYARENTKMKPHSFYAQAIPNGTYGFEEICRQASRNTSIEAHTIRAAVEEYLNIVMQKLCDGFRVEVGPQFLTCSPSLVAKVKDELNDDGTVKTVCTAADLKATGGHSRVKVSVHQDFTYEFTNSVKWQKTDRAGNAIDDEEDATLDDEEAANEQEQGGNSGEQNSGNSGEQNSGDSGNSGGSGNSGASATGYALTITKTGTGTASVTMGGNAVSSGSNLSEDDEVEITITPAEGQTPTASVNGSDIELTESDGTYTGSFAMPGQATTLLINTGTTGSQGDDGLDKD